MNAAVVWMDHTRAKILRLVPGKLESEQLYSGFPEAFGNERFFQDVVHYLQNMEEIMVAGPGHGDFLRHLKGNEIAQKIVAVDTADQVTEGQVFELARLFFKKFNVF